MSSIRFVIRWLATAALGALCACSSQGGIGPSGGCPSGQTLCGAACATLGSDPTNCGACGTVCVAGQACVGGVCKVDCGAGSIACGTGAAATCVNPKSDNDNCGGCGHACPAGQACGANGCAPTCPSGELLCAGQCVNPQTDNANCGGCLGAGGVTCAGGQVCSASRCQETCASGYTSCGGPDGGGDGGAAYCANLTGGDPNNCGACGVVCGAGSACCTAGQTTGCIDVLSNSDNCNGCGHSCLGLACQQGLCAASQLSSGLDPEDIKVDATNVYFLATFSVNQVPVDGGTTNNLSVGTSFQPLSLALGAQNVYWGDFPTDFVWGAPFDGGSPAIVSNFGLPIPLAGDPVPYGLAVDGFDVFYAGNTGDGGVILSVPLTLGNNIRVLANGPFTPNGLTIDSTWVYWTDVDGGAVMRTVKGGNQQPQILASGQSGPAGVAVDSSYVYWANEGAGEVMKRPLDGGPAVSIASGQNTPYRLAVDGTYAFWTDFDAGTVMKAPLAGGPATAVAFRQNGPAGIALDTGHVYWTNSVGGTVMKVPK